MAYLGGDKICFQPHRLGELFKGCRVIQFFNLKHTIFNIHFFRHINYLACRRFNKISYEEAKINTPSFSARIYVLKQVL